MNQSYSLLLVGLFLVGGCSGSSGSDIALLGGVQKGPFILGSAVDAYPVDATGQTTGGNVFHTETSSDLGQFRISFPAAAPFLLEATGYYYNEVAGRISTSQLTLKALLQLTDEPQQTATVNLVTHLTRGRIQRLLQAGKTLPLATAQAELELVRNLGIGGTDFSPAGPGVHMDLLGGDTIDNAYLFALGAVLAEAAAQKGGGDPQLSDAYLQELLNQMSQWMEDGQSFPVETMALLRKGELGLDTAALEAAFEKRLRDLGSSSVVPDLDQVLDQDHDGVINANDNCPKLYNPAQNPDDCGCGHCTPGNKRCEAGGVYTCLEVEGCVQWVGPFECTAGSCADAKACTCLGPCEQVNQQVCAGGRLHLCAVDLDGCLTQDFGIACQSGKCLDATRCTESATCQPGSCNGHGTCDASSGAIVCTCNAGFTGATCADCVQGCPTAGVTSCSQGQIKTCGTNDTGCRVWGAESACPSGTCTADGVSCADDSSSTCLSGTLTFPDWSWMWMCPGSECILTGNLVDRDGTVHEELSFQALAEKTSATTANICFDIPKFDGSFQIDLFYFGPDGSNRITLSNQPGSCATGGCQGFEAVFASGW